MPKRIVTTTIPAYVARTQLGSLLEQVAQKKGPFRQHQERQATAVLMSATDFDDMLEELDSEFQESLKVAVKEIRAGKGITLQQYVKGPPVD